MLNLQDTIENLLRATKREHIEKLLTIMRENEFYRRSCRGHHHWPGGLAQHSLEVMSRMQRQNTQELPIDSIVIVALLHQLYKVSGFKQYHHFGSRSVLIATREAGLRLTPMEYKAILWHMHGPREKGKIGADFDAVLDNPLWQLLRKADHYSCTHPMTEKEFEYAMGGKVRAIKLITHSEVGESSEVRPIRPTQSEGRKTELTPEEKRRRYIRRNNVPFADILEFMKKYGLNPQKGVEEQMKEDWENSPITIDTDGFNPNYLRRANREEIQEHIVQLQDICSQKQRVAGFVNKYIYKQHPNVFNMKFTFTEMYVWLKKEFKINCEIENFRKYNPIRDTLQVNS